MSILRATQNQPGLLSTLCAKPDIQQQEQQHKRIRVSRESFFPDLYFSSRSTAASLPQHIPPSCRDWIFGLLDQARFFLKHLRQAQLRELRLCWLLSRKSKFFFKLAVASWNFQLVSYAKTSPGLSRIHSRLRRGHSVEQFELTLVFDDLPELWKDVSVHALQICRNQPDRAQESHPHVLPDFSQLRVPVLQQAIRAPVAPRRPHQDSHWWKGTLSIYFDIILAV